MGWGQPISEISPKATLLKISDYSNWESSEDGRPLDPIRRWRTQVVSGTCLMSLSGYLLRSIGILFAFLSRFIVMLCLLKKTLPQLTVPKSPGHHNAPNIVYQTYSGPRREKTCLWDFANKWADQPAHPCSLISAFVIRVLESITSRLVTNEISIF